MWIGISQHGKHERNIFGLAPAIFGCRRVDKKWHAIKPVLDITTCKWGHPSVFGLLGGRFLCNRVPNYAHRRNRDTSAKVRDTCTDILMVAGFPTVWGVFA